MKLGSLIHRELTMSSWIQLTLQLRSKAKKKVLVKLLFDVMPDLRRELTERLLLNVGGVHPP